MAQKDTAKLFRAFNLVNELMKALPKDIFLMSKNDDSLQLCESAVLSGLLRLENACRPSEGMTAV